MAVSLTSCSYRSSHIGRGEDYDTALARTPVDSYMTEVELAIVTRIVDQLFPIGVARYLDFACGTGRITSVLESRAQESWGLDVSETMLARARARCCRTRFLLADITRDVVDIPHFDLITAFRFFGNAEDPLRLAVLNALWETLRPGGYLIVNNHRNRSSFRNLLLAGSGETPWGDMSHFRFIRLLRTAGFSPSRGYGVAWWLVRAALGRRDVFSSRVVHLVEPFSRLRLLAPFCPDVIVIARKESAHGH